MWLLNTSIISAGPCLPSHPHGRVAPQTRRSAPQPAGGQAHSERPGATPNRAPAENAIALRTPRIGRLRDGRQYLVDLRRITPDRGRVVDTIGESTVVETQRISFVLNVFFDASA